MFFLAEDENKITEEIGSLRQQINQLKTENSELQQVIAKLRYGQPPKEPLKDSADDDSVIRTWITDHFEGLNLTGFMEYLTQVAMDKKMARRELQQLQENLKSSYEQLSEKAKLGISTGKSILSEIQTNLQSKLEQMMNVADTSSKSALPMETIRKMGNIVKNTVEKMYKIGGDMLSSESTTPSSESNQANKLKKQMDKVFKSFTKQWDNIKSKMWGGGGTSTTPERASAMDEKNAKQEAKAESNWKKDAKRRDTGVEPKIKMTQTRMDHQDHKNKATVPENDVHHDRDNSPKSSKHVDKKKRKFQNDVNEYSKTSSQSNANLDTEKRDKNNNINNNKNNNHFKNSAFKSKGNANNELKMKTKQKITNQNGSNYSETSGDWLFKRSMDRSIKRKSKQQSDWLFDRAKDRQSQRKEATRSEWYFERSNHPKKHHDDDDDDADDWDDDDDYVNHKYADKKRYWNKIKYYRDFNDDYYHDDDDDDDDDNGESHKRWKKSNKKNKHRKNRKVHSDSDDEDSSDFEETTTEKNYKSKREYHKYWFNWAIPHPKSYVSS